MQQLKPLIRGTLLLALDTEQDPTNTQLLLQSLCVFACEETAHGLPAVVECAHAIVAGIVLPARRAPEVIVCCVSFVLVCFCLSVFFFSSACLSAFGADIYLLSVCMSLCRVGFDIGPGCVDVTRLLVRQPVTERPGTLCSVCLLFQSIFLLWLRLCVLSI